VSKFAAIENPTGHKITFSAVYTGEDNEDDLTHPSKINATSIQLSRMFAWGISGYG